MRKNWTSLVCIIVLLCSAQASNAESKDSKQITCTGKVVDDQGRPVADAKIEMYRVAVETAILSFKLQLRQEATTDADGLFTLKSTASDDDSRNAVFILAVKEGMALGWANWQLRQDANVEITLGPPKVLAGVVVDENGSPIADADIGISFMLVQAGGQPRFMVGDLSLAYLTTRTDAEGKFSFDRMPADASAELVVKKAGRATISTFDPRGFQGRSLRFAAGRTDVKITQPQAAKIEGVVVTKADGKPVTGVQLLAVRDRNQPAFGAKPVVSQEDGTFSIDGLPPGEHLLQIVSPLEAPANWITEPVHVTTEAGETTSGVKIELIKGGLLEVLVTDSISKKPVENATVSVQPAGGGTGSGARTDKAGIARTRLTPGQYRINYLYKQGYSRQRAQQDVITIEDGKTAHVEIQLAGMPKMTGVVRDDQDRPVEGVSLKVCPMSGQDAVSDAEGKFEVSWDPGGWSSSRPPAMILLARDKERNMAATVDVDEDTRTVDVTLRPGVTFTGKVVGPDGKGIAGASLLVMIRGPRWGSSIENRLATDAEGNYEIKALAPRNKYSVEASADGFGRCQIEADAGEAVDNRLNVSTLTLLAANLSVSGVVVDSNDEPVAGADVSCWGDTQPRSRTATDADGKFTLEKVCAGNIRVSANKRGTPPIYGQVETEGGATDVKIVLRQASTAMRYEPKRPPSLVGRGLPDLKDVNVSLSTSEIEGKRLLVCFWDMQQRPSRHCLTQLTQQADQLKGRGIVVVAVQATTVEQNVLDEYVKKYHVPFSVGMVQGEAEKIRFKWGVRSLPWLILTDDSHVIISQGFSLVVLDKQLGQNGP
ncbi:MAG: carboxypeptidase regulatory-like domain-containing protein [Sedimentisphaerales bacterium]